MPMLSEDDSVELTVLEVSSTDIPSAELLPLKYQLLSQHKELIDCGFLTIRFYHLPRLDTRRYRHQSAVGSTMRRPTPCQSRPNHTLQMAIVSIEFHFSC